MDVEKEYKEIAIQFVYSKELDAHNFGIVFDSDYSNLPLPNLSGGNFNDVQKFTVKNNKTNNIKLVAVLDSASGFKRFASKDFSFEEAKIYYLQIISSKQWVGDVMELSEYEIQITDYDPSKENIQ